MVKLVRSLSRPEYSKLLTADKILGSLKRERRTSMISKKESLKLRLATHFAQQTHALKRLPRPPFNLDWELIGKVESEEIVPAMLISKDDI